MKIVMVAGGTGGHIYPALTLAESLKKRGHEIVFFGSLDRMEKDIVPEYGYKFVGLDVKTTQGSLTNKIKSLISIKKEYKECLKLLKGYDLVIGFGNYISVPVILAAKKLGLKTIIHEQNSFVGKANKLLDQKVDLVIGSYDEDKEQFKNKNTLILGNPQSQRAYEVKEDDDTLTKLGLKKDKKTVVIFMGSLGSETINNILVDYFKMLDGSYQVVYAAGKNYYEHDKEIIKETEYLKVLERIDGIKVMKSSDLLVSRAGATTLSEITSLGMPSILIPSPYVPNNHQYYNAKSLVDKNAALMIEEKDFSAKKLFETINSIINDDKTLSNLSENALKLAHNSVVDDIVKEIEKL